MAFKEGLSDPPSNDDCSNAEPVSIDSYTYGYTFGATPDVAPVCGDATDDSGGGVWYTVEGNGQTLIALLCSNANFGTQIRVYSGSCGALECVAGNNRNDTYCNNGSLVNWNSISGTTYYILVELVDGFGEFELRIVGLDPPPNDDCSNAEPVSINSSTYAYTFGATPDVAPACGDATDDSGSGVWYTVEGNGQTLTASLCDYASFDTQIRVYTGSCGALECVAGDNDGCESGKSIVNWNSVSGITYYVLVHGRGAAFGEFSLLIAETPPNDDCMDAITVLPNTTVLGSTYLASPNVAPNCGDVSYSLWGGVWYQIVGNGQSFTASLCEGTNFDSQIRIFSGTCGALNCVAGDDDGCGYASMVNWCSEPGITYYILVDGYGSSSGNFMMTLSGEDIPTEKPAISFWGNSNNTEAPILISSWGGFNQWFLNGNAIVGSTGKTHVVTKEGIYTVEARTGNCDGYMSDPFPMITTGDIFMPSSSMLNIFPNPASIEIIIRWDSPGEKKVYVYDLLGRRMETFFMNLNEHTLDISNYTSGQYIVKGVQGGKSVQNHFIKK